MTRNAKKLYGQIKERKKERSAYICVEVVGDQFFRRNAMPALTILRGRLMDNGEPEINVAKDGAVTQKLFSRFLLTFLLSFFL